MHLERKLKICVLLNDNTECSSSLKDVDNVPREVASYAPNAEVDIEYLTKSNSVATVISLSRKGYDCFINLCDGGVDEDRAGIEVVQALEKTKQAYTGADLRFYDPTKEQMKLVAISNNVKTAPYVVSQNDDDTQYACETLACPVIVKHYNGYSSVGMTRDSRCETIDEVKVQALATIQAYGKALIEEFIEGREFTVLVAENHLDPSEPITFKPIECVFPQGESFKHFELKWVNFSGLKWVPCDEADLEEQLRVMAKKMFVALNGVGYARLDVRMNSKREMVFLEINPNCGVFYADNDSSADFILQLEPEKGHKFFTNHIVQCAMARLKCTNDRVKYTHRFRPGKGMGLYATRRIGKGEVVDSGEEQGMIVTSMKNVRENWVESQKHWFKRYCFPVSESLYVMPSKDLKGWILMNHSCNPNVAIEALTLRARRPIETGEELTIDYASVYVDCEEFKCNCGDATCRGVVTGGDYLLLGTFGMGASDWVNTLRKAETEKYGALNQENSRIG